MLAAFDSFVARIAARYQEARELMAQGKYAEAHQILATLATSHARTSMSLRNVLVRNGLLPEDN